MGMAVRSVAPNVPLEVSSLIPVISRTTTNRRKAIPTTTKARTVRVCV
jgi:hypothetical protein